MNVIAMFKKISRIKYPYRCEQLNIKEIYSQNKMHRVKSKFSSKPVNPLNLIWECHSLSYDALTAHVATVFTKYMLLTMEQLAVFTTNLEARLP